MYRFVCLISLLAVVYTFAICRPQTGESLKPVRTLVPPNIDGKLDDPVWSKALSVTNFKTFIPDFGKVIPESTVAYAAYDDENLYFAFRCFDPDPSAIKATIGQRDNIRRDDWICLNIDTFNDQQALFAFYANPHGIQMDSRGTNTSEDFSVDFVWYSAGQIDEQGYTVEVSIPLKSIRYSDADPTFMSIFFERQIGRRLEHVSYPSLDPQKGYQFLTQMQPLEYTGLKHYAFWELLPAFTYSNRYHHDQGELTQFKNQGETSFTAKYGITPQLILDGTYNPDFSQVEADAGQVDINLRSNLFFSEKRPFFLEGTDILTLGGVDQGRQQGILYGVYTRTIVHPLVGLKLSGKVSRDGSLASIVAIDDLTDGRATDYGKRAVFPIFRYKQALNGDSYIGGVYMGREWGTTFNRVGGVDGVQRVTAGGTLEYHFLGSSSRSTDSTNANKGLAMSIIYRHNSRDMDWGVQGNKVSEDFQLDAGYLTRTGLLSFDAYFIPKFYPSSRFINRIDLAMFGSTLRDDPSGLWETSNRVTLSAVILGSLSASARYNYSTEVFGGQRFLASGVQLNGGGQFSKEVNFTVTYRFDNAVIYSASPEQGKSTVITTNLNIQPWEHFDLTVSVIYANLFRTSDDSRVYDYPIGRFRLTYQVNRYWFIRAITEYNGYRKTITDDFLASFTYIPGTVVHLGYGSLFQRTAWDQTAYVPSDSYLETYRGIFFKMSYLWRS
ncbi:MAG: carbohydrate binding family 9 domain-containing protein [Ignavibacteriales bacterium]|nr:carbohydrate binding family 9 domain-containing protein [Ignavibacteriales bacterium]